MNAALLLTLSCLHGGVLCADEFRIRESLQSLDPHVLPVEHRDRQRTMVGRYLKLGIDTANAASAAEWKRIQSRDDWRRFRHSKLERLAHSLSQHPFAPGKPNAVITGSVRRDGFRIDNVVLQPEGRTVITANLYLPDPPRPSMPGIVLAHSHHNPKHEGELQDMGMTWARVGCCVLVPDLLGHGERRQHPYESAGDFAGEFAVGRQDYYFRYDLSLQLYLVGESLIGWMAHDLMTCVDTLLERPGVDRKRIILLGSVAGGGDVAAVTAALDERIACVVPVNFGGPQPESPYPLPPDSETRFNYAGFGSWESTRNLPRSASDGFLPWVIVGSIAPRNLIHAHEFAWDQDRDPVWKRYQRIWGFYFDRSQIGGHLAFAQGHGTLTSKDPPGSHCNNIGLVHRRQIQESFREWFAIDVRPEDEYRNRRPAAELRCLTTEAIQQLQPKSLGETLQAIADRRLTSTRTERSQRSSEERRSSIRRSWEHLLGNVEPSAELKVLPGSPPVEERSGITVKRETLETEPGITIPLMTLSCTGTEEQSSGAVLWLATGGIAEILRQRQDEIVMRLGRQEIIFLLEARGMGESSSGTDRGQQGTATAHSATQLMLGQPILAAQLRDLRAVWRHVLRHPELARKNWTVIGEGGGVPRPADSAFSFPRRINGRPPECQPAGAMLAALLALFERDVQTVSCRRGLISYRSVLDCPFVQVPHECLVPGQLLEVDVPDLLSALAPRNVEVVEPVDGLGRLVTRN